MAPIYISDNLGKQEAHNEINNLNVDDGYFYEVSIKRIKATRTNKQNRAMHKYFTLLAIALNNAGYDMRKLLRNDIEIPWTEHTVKDNLWRPIQIAVVNKESTADLDTDEPAKVDAVLSRHLSEKTGVYVPWPSLR